MYHTKGLISENNAYTKQKANQTSRNTQIKLIIVHQLDEQEGN